MRCGAPIADQDNLSGEEFFGRAHRRGRQRVDPGCSSLRASEERRLIQPWKGLSCPENQRVERNRQERPGEDETLSLRRQQAKLTPRLPRMKENSPIWEEAGSNRPSTAC